MSPAIRAICGFGLFAILGSAQADHCLKPGETTVFDGVGSATFIVISSHPDGDLRFELPGSSYEADADAPPDKIEFFVDGVHYEFLTTAASEFVEPGEAADPMQILPRHAAAEHAYAVKVGSQLTKFQELERTYQEARGNTPKLYFLQWRFSTSSSTENVSQYVVSTVIGRSVASFTAIVTTRAQEDLVRASLARFSTSFQFVEAKTDCPKTQSP